MDKFIDNHNQHVLQKQLHGVLLGLVRENQPSNSVVKSYERRDSTLSGIPNLSSRGNKCWRQALDIVSFASRLYAALVLAELCVSPDRRPKDLKHKRLAVLSIVEDFPALDEDNVSCVDMWLKCAFWSSVLSKMRHLLEFNVGGKGAGVKKVLTMALLEAEAAVVDVFSVWIGILSTACLQPEIVSEIGLLLLQNALQSRPILQCMPKKCLFLSQCMSQLKSLRYMDVCLTDNSPTLNTEEGFVSSQNKAEEGGVLHSVSGQMHILYSFSVVVATRLHDLPREGRRDVKEKQLKPLVDMLHR